MAKNVSLPGGNLPPQLSAPAQRALTGAGITSLEQLAQYSEEEVKRLHGVGPNALSVLRQAMDERGLAFRQQDQDLPTQKSG